MQIALAFLKSLMTAILPLAIARKGGIDAQRAANSQNALNDVADSLSAVGRVRRDPGERERVRERFERD